MSAVNGQSVTPAQPDPRLVVAEAVYTAMSDEGDPSFAEIEADDLADILTVTENYLTAHLNFLNANGFRIVPPGAISTPKSEEEAMAMVRAAKSFLDALKRRGKLMTAGPTPAGLILPPGMKH